MAYEIALHEKNGYLHAVVTGHNGVENLLSYLDDIREECNKRGRFRVLIEDRIEGRRLGLTEMFKVVMQARERYSGPMPTVAFVDRHAPWGLLKLAEHFASVRGMNVWMFPTVDEAATWLERYGDPDPAHAQAGGPGE